MKLFAALSLFVMMKGSLLVAQETNLISAPSHLPQTKDLQQLEVDTYNRINLIRKSNGLLPLQWNEKLAIIAREHSRKMALKKTDFGHDGFQDRVKLARSQIAQCHAYGENVLRTDYQGDLSQIAAENWIHSPHHYKNIVGDFNLTGMGVWQDSTGCVYFTQFFVKVNPVQPAGALSSSLVTCDPEPGHSGPFQPATPWL